MKLVLYILLMINPSILTSNLQGLVGFRQPYNPKYQVIDAANQKSRSGLYITDNPFVKVETIYDSQDYSGIVDADFNTWLRNKINTSIINVANAVFNENDFVDRQMFYKHALNKQSITNTGDKNAKNNYVNVYDLPPGFNCYWIQVTNDNDVAFVIKRINLEFNGSGSLTLYLFNTADLTTPLYSQSVTINAPLVEVTLNDADGNATGWICDNTSKGKGYKGDYYLGYFTTDAAGLKPFKRDYRESIIESEIKDMTWRRANFADFVNKDAPFDLTNYSPFAWYNGMNPDITSYIDYTDLITQNERLFARAIMLDCQISLLSESIASIRSNRNERISSQYVAQMMTQIEGENTPGNVKVTGLRPQWYGAISAARKEVKKLQNDITGKGLIISQTLS